MSNYYIKPEKINSITNEIVETCRMESKGKAKQQIIKKILLKRAGFQSQQTFDNYIKNNSNKEERDSLSYSSELFELCEEMVLKMVGSEKYLFEQALCKIKNKYEKNSKNKKIVTMKDFYEALSYKGLRGQNYIYEYNSVESINLFKKVFDISIDNNNFVLGISDDGDSEGISINDGISSVYLLDIKYAYSLIEDLSDNSNTKFLVYKDSLKYEGCFLGTPDVLEGTLKTFDNFMDAVEYTKELLKK